MGVHAHGHHIVSARIQRVRHVEGHGIVAASPVADAMAVHPGLDAVERAVEMQEDALSAPAGGHGEMPAVVTGALVRRGIFGRGESLQLPMGGHGGFRPRRVGEARGGKIGGGSDGSGLVAEFPSTVERLGLFTVADGVHFLRLCTEQPGKHRERQGEHGRKTESRAGHGSSAAQSPRRGKNRLGQLRRRGPRQHQCHGS